ncbi:MAG: amidohydrolase family protein [Pirellulaceae bacterium]
MSINTKLHAALLIFGVLAGPASAQVAVHGETVYTMAGEPIKDAVVVIRKGKIAAIGKAGDVAIPKGFRVLRAKVVTPGLVDAHSVVGLAGILNYNHDQDQLERSNPVQPQLRAIDAYNSSEELIAWVRSFGVTTLHTGHGPGELISGQTMIVKTVGNTIDDALIAPSAAVAATISPLAEKSGADSPGTRGKMIAMLRAEFLKAQEYRQKQQAAKKDKDADPPSRDLKLEALTQVLDGKLKLMVTADRAQDIASALRLAKEFDIDLWLDGAAESYLLIDDIKRAGVPVLIHPTMVRAVGEKENMSFETASKLVKAGIPVALQSGFESYVPKTRVVLFEAGMAAANGLTFEQALATITIDAARILGIDNRVGSLAVGKDGDVALYNGDPFEYTTHCIGVVINGEVVSETVR